LQVEVRVFCGLEKCIPGARFGQPIPVEVPEGTSSYELLEMLNIPRKDAFSLLVNGMHKEFEAALADGDRVSIFPPVGGG